MQQLATCARSKSLSVDAGGLVPLEEVFLDVDSTALAAASIAQVYNALPKVYVQIYNFT